MPPSLPAYDTTEGSFGFPMHDRQARRIDTLLKAPPKSKERAYQNAPTV